jgi:hypothetical protein
MMRHLRRMPVQADAHAERPEISRGAEVSGHLVAPELSRGMETGDHRPISNEIKRRYGQNEKTSGLSEVGGIDFQLFLSPVGHF